MVKYVIPNDIVNKEKDRIKKETLISREINLLINR
jgi:hypothetical protein